MSRWMTLSKTRIFILLGVLLVLLLLVTTWPVGYARHITTSETDCGAAIPVFADASNTVKSPSPSAFKVAAWWWLTALPTAWSLTNTQIDSDTDGIKINDPQRLHLFIDRFASRLTLFEGDRQIVSYPVAVGKPSTPSPPGEWRIIYKGKNWGGGFGTRWLGFNVPWGIYGIHGTNKPGSIGTEASAGCIRMHNRDVEELWDVVPVGTRVVVTGDLPTVSGRDQLASGISGKFVTVLQFRLRQAGYASGLLDGRLGPDTAGAIGIMQQLYGWPVTGSLDRDQQRLLWFPQ